MSDPITIHTRSTEQTMALGAAVARCCAAGDVLLLDGELGAGKTQFVRGMAMGLGLDPRVVSSPTFVFVQEYEPEEGDGLVLVHIDAYRLNGPEDLGSIGWEDDGAELRDGAVVAVEWASKLGAALPADHLTVRIQHEQAGRRITLTPSGDWTQRSEQLAAAVESSKELSEAES